MKIKAYMPDFGRAFEHFCIHTGGRGVIDGMEKQLGLTAAHMQPTRDALFRFGNVSSSSIWCSPPLLTRLPAALLHNGKIVIALLCLKDWSVQNASDKISRPAAALGCLGQLLRCWASRHCD